MNENYKKPSFKKLLEKLQEDSWQLELLISGFAIFGLFYAIKPVEEAFFEALKGDETIFISFFYAVNMFLYILIFNLVLHVVLRGLWIGALGLRYVSGEIDFNALNYSKVFTKYLKRKVGSFDNYIGKLENYCSVIFAISFLLIFYVISIGMFAILIALIGNGLIQNDFIPKWIGKTLLVITVFGGLLTLFDLLTAGLLKKKQWISIVYFPFYWFFSILTLSFLYRPLVYNFLDNKFGKRISLLLIPFYTFVMIISTFFYQKSNFFTEVNVSNSIIANHDNYEDIKEDTFLNLFNFTIQSKVITDSYIKIYTPFYKSMEDVVFDFNADLKPEKDERGLRSSFISSFKVGLNQNRVKQEKELLQDSLRFEYLKTFNKIYTIQVDSTIYKTDFVVDKIKAEKFGFEMYLGIKSLSEGKHMLVISKQIKKDSIGYKKISIPFWYYPN